MRTSPLTRLIVLLAALAMAVTGLVAAPQARAFDPEAHQGNKVAFPGNDGRAHEVTWDKNSFMIDGERLQIWSGELHHWRVPSEDGWRDVLQKLRASGYNAVSLYFFWGMHQSVEGGPFDFSAPHEIDRLLTMAAEEGLYVIARRYGFFEGSVWYRAHFKAAGSTPMFTFRGNGGSGVPGHGRNPAFMQVWVNGVYAGARPANGGTVSVAAPAGSVTAGQDAVVAVAVHSLGHNLDWSDDGLSRQNRGLYEASLGVAASEVRWRINGADHTEADDADPVRGLYNRGGLYGERAGWYLPGYPTSDWQPTGTLEADAPGVTWYRTTAELDVPEGQDTAWRLEVESTRFDNGRTDGSQVNLYVNGWLTGIHIGDIGPQDSFTIPSGFINPSGLNEIAVSVAAKTAGQGPQDIRLVPVHSTTGAPADFDATPAPEFPELGARVSLDATSVVDGGTVTATGTLDRLPAIAAGADVELRYLWTAPGGEPVEGPATQELTGVGTHAVQLVVVDVVNGQRLAASEPVEVVVGDGSLPHRGAV